MCLLSFPCWGQTFSLSGYVVDGLTGRAMSEVKLHLYDIPYDSPGPVGTSGPAAPPVTTDSDGHFAFIGLSAGYYGLQAELPHEIVTYGETTEPLYSLGYRRVEVGAEWEGRIVLFRVLPGAVLTGTIHDGYGEPVEGAGTELYRLDRRGGRIGLVPVGRAGVDDRGHFSIGELAPGDYVICATGGWRHAPSGEGAVEYRPNTPSRVYSRTCYPDPNSQSAYFRIEAGGRPHLSITLTSTPSFLLRVTGLVQPAPASFSTGRVWTPFSLRRDDATASEVPLGGDTLRLPNGGVEIPDVPPGHYVVEARVVDFDGLGSVARREIIVSNQPPAPIELTPVSDARIKVDLRGPDGNTPDAEAATVTFIPASAGLTVRPLDRNPGIALDPGAYWLSIRTRPPFCATSARLGGQEVMRRRIAVGSGMSARLDVELSRHCGTIDIHTVAEGKAVPFSDFLLLLSGTPQEPGGVLTGGSDARGQVSIGRLPAGRYLLWAWLPDGHGYVGPNLADGVKEAVEVVVTADRTTSISVTPIQLPGGAR
jgi:protocatechuate 3,4-dioxygenase beta subunit